MYASIMEVIAVVVVGIIAAIWLLAVTQQKVS
jgi:hypothetical protein